MSLVDAEYVRSGGDSIISPVTSTKSVFNAYGDNIDTQCLTDFWVADGSVSSDDIFTFDYQYTFINNNIANYTLVLHLGSGCDLLLWAVSNIPKIYTRYSTDPTCHKYICDTDSILGKQTLITCSTPGTGIIVSSLPTTANSSFPLTEMIASVPITACLLPVQPLYLYGLGISGLSAGQITPYSGYYLIINGSIPLIKNSNNYS